MKVRTKSTSTPLFTTSQLRPSFRYHHLVPEDHSDVSAWRSGAVGPDDRADSSRESHRPGPPCPTSSGAGVVELSLEVGLRV